MMMMRRCSLKGSVEMLSQAWQDPLWQILVSRRFHCFERVDPISTHWSGSFGLCPHHRRGLVVEVVLGIVDATAVVLSPPDVVESLELDLRVLAFDPFLFRMTMRFHKTGQVQCQLVQWST